MGRFFPTATVLAALLAGLAVVPVAQAQDAEPVLWSLPLRPAASVARSLGASAAGAHEHGGEPAAEASTLTEPFQVAAISWEPGGEVTGASVRVREGGRWTEWFELGVIDDGVAGHRVSTEPVISGEADGVEAVVETADGRPPRDVRIDLVRAPETTAARAAAAANGNVAPGDELRPAIVTRAQWGADERITKDSPSFDELKAMYVHHTAGSNGYSAAQAPGIVKAIHVQHVKSNGWPDIGYQFLVDRFGTVYEGRRGSLERLVLGAQAGGYNTGTIGVSGLGNFHSTGTNPSSKMREAIIQVLSWQAHKWGLDPTGTVRLRTGSSTGSGTKWKPGELTDPLPKIIGHRDTNITACPGDDLYSRLPAIRREVTARVELAVQTWGSPAAGLPRPAVKAWSSSQAPVRTPNTVTLKWSAVAGADRYEVLVRRAPHDGPLSPKDGWDVLGTTSDTRFPVTLRLGTYHELGVRAVDAGGTRGPVATAGPVTRPLGYSAKITASGGWVKKKVKGYFKERAYRTTRAGETLTVTGVKDVRELWIIAPTTKGDGRIAVFVNGTKVRTTKLDHPTKKQRRIRVALPQVSSGTITITTVDAGKRVRISGLAFVR